MAENIMGMPRSEVLNQNLWDTFPEVKDLKFFQNYHQAVDSKETASFEEYFPPLDMWIEVNAYPSDDGLSIFFRNITNRKLREKKLEDSLQEKETLLIEIHHRVKNNLAVVSGLMQLQAFNSDNEALREHLNASVNRIKTIASIHELLYSSTSFSKLDTGEIAKKLINELIQSFEVKATLNTKFELQSVKLNINQAIPLSLIVNEVVTNILKHAFTGKEQGTVTVFISESDQTVTLRIIDNGKGLPKGFPDNFETNSLGLLLIETLSSQLNADYSYETKNGETHFTLTFEKKEIKGSSSALMH
jgi:two-component sensor histidine kinase